MIEIYPPTTEVQVGPTKGGLKGVVLSVQIRSAENGVSVAYEVGSWDDGRWTEQWFNSFMVTSKSDKEKIGFGKAQSV